MEYPRSQNRYHESLPENEVIKYMLKQLLGARILEAECLFSPSYDLPYQRAKSISQPLETNILFARSSNKIKLTQSPNEFENAMSFSTHFISL
jgi:hypothetical protein